MDLYCGAFFAAVLVLAVLVFLDDAVPLDQLRRLIENYLLRRCEVNQATREILFFAEK